MKLNKNLYLLLILGVIVFLLLPTLAETRRCDCVDATVCMDPYPLGCYVDTTDDAGGKSSCTIGDNKKFPGNFCSGWWRACDDGETKCQNEACPLEPSSSWNGKTCSVNRLHLISCFTEIRTGKWNASLSQCVICSGSVKTHKIGDAAGLYVDYNGNYQSGADIADKCESACGASLACDEVAPGGYLNSCNNHGKTYFRDWCTASWCLTNDDTSVCEASFTGCTADPACDGKAPGVGASCGTNKICDDTCQCVTACECSSTAVGGCCDGCNFCPNGTVYNGSACVSPDVTYYCGIDDVCSPGSCLGTRNYRACDGAGSCRSDNLFAYAGNLYAAAGKVWTSTCTNADSSPSLYCNVYNDCTDGSCVGHKYYRSCNGSGSCRNSNTDAYDETVYPLAGYTLTSACGVNGTSYCQTNQCRDGGGWHHKCSKRCDASHICNYWIDASCVDHCTNGVWDCDETGVDSGGSCEEECTPHHHYCCYNNDVYWYDSCNTLEDKLQECGDGSWTSSYQCSGDMVQRQYHYLGCSGSCSSASCYDYYGWVNWEDCAAQGKTCENGVCVAGCSGTLTVSISGSVTCTVTADLNASNCDGKSWEVKDDGTTKCSGTVSGSPYSHTCSSWTVGEGSYIYNLYIDGVLKDSDSVTCPAVGGDLVAYWKFDEGSGSTAFDSSEYGNDAYLVGNPSWPTGMFNSALEFDGIDDYTWADDSSSLDITQDLSMAMWVYPKAVEDKVLLGKQGAYGLALTSGENRIKWVIWGADWVTNTTLSPNDWYCLVATYDYPNNRYLYVDKVQVDSIGTNVSIPTTDDKVTMAKWDTYTFEQYFNGILDEVQIWKKPLSQAEIDSFCQPPTHTLSGTITGTGSGIVNVDPSTVFPPDHDYTTADGGFTETYDSGTTVTLTPTALTGSYFAGWLDCDSVTEDICTMNMTSDKTVTATFNTACSDLNYPADKWQRVWYEYDPGTNSLTNCLGDGPDLNPDDPGCQDANCETFDIDWGGGILAYDRGDLIGFRSSRTINFPSAGTYRFTVGSDDGVRLWIDGTSRIDQWVDQGYTTYSADVDLTAGNHTFRIDYYEKDGGAKVSFSFIVAEEIPPTTQIISPEAGSWHDTSFPVEVLDWDEPGGSGLKDCFYHIFDDNQGDWTVAWGSRTCGSEETAQSFLVTVGLGENCEEGGENTCHVIAFSRDNAGNEGSDERAFSIGVPPVNPPTVTTNPATNIGTTTAKLSGTIIDTGGENCDQIGFDYDTNSGEPYSFELTSLGDYPAINFSYIYGLFSKGELYYFRAKAHNSAGWGYGGEKLFLTKPDPPIPNEPEVISFSELKLTWANGEGADFTEIYHNQDSCPTSPSVTDYGAPFRFDLNAAPTTEITVTGLEPDTPYCFGFWSTAEGGGLDPQYSDYSAATHCKCATTETAVTAPDVTTLDAQSIIQTWAVLWGKLVDRGGAGPGDVKVWFEWGLTDSYGNETGHQTKDSTGNFSFAIGALTPNTTYHFRAVAKNTASGEMDYGVDMSFKTLAEGEGLKLVFVSSQTYTGNLGGVSGADAKCQNLSASISGLSPGSTFKAWLSTDIESASDRLIHWPGDYVLIDGTVIANGWTDLTDGTLAHTINLYETGGDCIGSPQERVWTDTNTDGTLYNAPWDCVEWTDGSSGESGFCGWCKRTDLGWTTGQVRSCDENLRLFCFQEEGTFQPCECTSDVIGGCCDGCNFCPAGLVNNGAGQCVTPDSTYNCYSWNNCADGDCSATKRWYGCLGGEGGVILEDDFDPDVDGAWSLLNNASANTNCGSVTGNALYFTGTGERSAATEDIDTSGGGTMSFYLRFGTGAAPCENADAGEDVVLEYSTDGGSIWTNINTYDTEAYTNFTTQVSETIPSGAQTNATRFRWRQLSHNGSNFDNWAIDNVSINVSSGGEKCSFAQYQEETVTATDGYVLRDDCSEALLSCTDYCAPAGNYCTSDRYVGEFRQACGGTGSCNGEIIGCSNIQDCGATSDTCSTNCQKDYTYTCLAGSCGTYHTYTTAAQDERCSAGSLITTGWCATSAYYDRSADKCDKKRDIYRCDGLGSLDTNCSYDVGDDWSYVSAYKIADHSGQEVEASSADNTGTCHDCTEGACSGTYRWGECDGSGNPGPCSTYNQSETVYADLGYSLTSSCGITGTTLCDSTWRASTGSGDNYYGKGGDYNCQGMCDGLSLCEYAVNCEFIDTTAPTTEIKIFRISPWEDVTGAEEWLRADDYEIQFVDEDPAPSSGWNYCEYYIYDYQDSIYVVSPTSTTCGTWSFGITAGTPPYHKEGVGAYLIYRYVKDNADLSDDAQIGLNFDFTLPETWIE